MAVYTEGLFFGGGAYNRNGLSVCEYGGVKHGVGLIFGGGGGGGANWCYTVYVLWLCLIAIIYIYLWTFVGVQSAFGGGEWCKVLIRGVSTNKIFYFCSF
jgi:hypothetical protein